MIAEIKGKLSQTGSNLTERLEDNLTGNFFGALRYIPFHLVLGKILSNSIYPPEIASYFNKIKIDFWSDSIAFWPYDMEGEIDALLSFDDLIIGIEVKFLSGLSSDDNIGSSDNGAEQIIEAEKDMSINQLARESRIVSKNGEGKTKILLFIASSSSCREVYDDVINRNPPIIENGVLLGYISWQSILEELKSLKLDNQFYQIIIEDLISLLIKKGFECFKDMSVDLLSNIEQEGFYDFGGTSSSIFILFDTNIKIEGEVYYEFS